MFKKIQAASPIQASLQRENAEEEKFESKEQHSWPVQLRLGCHLRQERRTARGRLNSTTNEARGRPRSNNTTFTHLSFMRNLKTFTAVLLDHSIQFSAVARWDQRDTSPMENADWQSIGTQPVIELVGAGNRDCWE